MSEKYRKKPVVVDVVQFDGDNYQECKDFIGDNFDNTMNCPNIKTLEGVMTVSIGDFIIKGVKGEFYPCKPDIFEQTYEKATRQSPKGLTEDELTEICAGFGVSTCLGQRYKLVKAISKAYNEREGRVWKMERRQYK